MRDGFQMFWIDTQRISTEMVKLHTVRDRTFCK